MHTGFDTIKARETPHIVSKLIVQYVRYGCPGEQPRQGRNVTGRTVHKFCGSANSTVSRGQQAH